MKNKHQKSENQSKTQHNAAFNNFKNEINQNSTYLHHINPLNKLKVFNRLPKAGIILFNLVVAFLTKAEKFFLAP